MESCDEVLVESLGTLYHVGHGVGEPVFELLVGLEHVGHEEVHERPEFHQIVLEWSSGEK